MKKPLLDVVFASDKRKNVLLLLQDGAKEMGNLLSALNTTRTALLPQIRILEEHYLVSHILDRYELTPIGKLLVDSLSSLLAATEVLDEDIDYWGDHKLDFLPPHLLKRIGQLRKCRIVTPSFADVFNLNEEILSTSPISGSHHGFVTFYHPLFPQFFAKMVSNNVNIYMIIPQDVLDRFKAEESMLLKETMKSELFHLFVYPEKPDFIALVYNDYYTFVRLLKNNGEFGNRYIICNSEESHEWAKELYDHYLGKSVQISEI
ncbi:transcriptional regulator [Methanolobus chelungpuianus]|uniref:Transcriptional regulator n=1 Tax=Methanolobus chelungpuianus TaxID=502115 RepID=A0AAE3HAZ1_9EURY|nr:winged helix-turn-helix domain-containing protein [Methanolobus chelungpuianus]MCQ6963031.1 transcriptional regulator [Methanolobus chelungpuianus]